MKGRFSVKVHNMPFGHLFTLLLLLVYAVLLRDWVELFGFVLL